MFQIVKRFFATRGTEPQRNEKSCGFSFLRNKLWTSAVVGWRLFQKTLGVKEAEKVF